MKPPPSLLQELKQAPSLKQQQYLMMSPQMQQALHFLQLPHLELSTIVLQELEKNPLLEIAGDAKQKEEPVQKELLDKTLKFDENDFTLLQYLEEEFRGHFLQSETGCSPKREQELESFKENSIQAVSSLFEHLTWQASYTFSKKEDYLLAEELIGHLDDRGYLTTPLEEISLINGVSLIKLEAILKKIQFFDPPGIAARSVQEVLLIQLQLAGKKESLAYRVVETHFTDLLKQNFKKIQNALHCTEEELKIALHKDLSSLNLNPGSQFCKSPTIYLQEDLSILPASNGELSVEVQNDSIPSLRFNSRYLKLLDNGNLPKETKDYILKKLSAGKGLLKSLEQREQTLLRLGKLLAKKQHAYFSHEKGALLPMTMRPLAEELELHESTIARTVANKYVQTIHGLIPLRSLFTSSYTTNSGEEISSKSVKELLLSLLQKEDSHHPFSDEELSLQIKQRGLNCARRTVAKYRKELKIGSCFQRKLINK